MAEQVVSGAKAPLFGGRKLLFTQKELLRLTGPLLVEKLASRRPRCAEVWWI